MLPLLPLSSLPSVAGLCGASNSYVLPSAFFIGPYNLRKSFDSSLLCFGAYTHPHKEADSRRFRIALPPHSRLFSHKLHGQGRALLVREGRVELPSS